MKDTKQVVTTTTKAVAMGNGRVKFNRVVKNLFLMLFGKETKMAGIDELKVEGCFSRIQKEKNNLMQILDKQKDAISKMTDKADADTKVVDKEIEEIRKEIIKKEVKLQGKLAKVEDDKAEISLEMDRCNRVCKRMDEFFA